MGESMKISIKLFILPILVILLFSNITNIDWAYTQSDWDKALKKTLYIDEIFDISELAYNTVGTKELRWFSSNDDVATIDSKGIIVTKGAGKTLIQANSNDGSSLPHFSLGLTVYDGISGLELIAPKQELFVGEKLQLSWIVLGSNPQELSHENVTFKSSRPNIISVDSKGNLLAKEDGFAFISIQANNDSARDLLKFTVNNMVKKVSIEEVPEILAIGEKFEAKAYIFPTDAIEKSIYWSSSSNAAVSQSGLITPLKEGIAYITATSKDGGKKDTVKIIINSLVRAVQLSESQLSLKVGETHKISATVIPKIKGKEPFLKGVKWENKYPNVATISSDGKITALSAGTTKITAISDDGGKRATCTVKVSGGIKSKVQAAFTEEAKNIRTIYTNEPVLLPYTITKPSSDNADPKVTIIGKKEYKYNILDNAIEFTALEVGDFAVILGEDNKTSSVSVSAISRIKSINIYTDDLERDSNNKYKFYIGQKGQLYGSCVPVEDKYLDSLRWKSSDTSIISIDDNGNYKANKIGEANISLFTSDMSHKKIIFIEVVGLADKISTAKDVKMGTFVEYEPEVNFTIPKHLQNQFSTALNQEYELKIKKIYLHKSYLNTEIRYELSRKKEWRDAKKDGYDKKNNLKPPINKCIDRISYLKSFAKNDNYYNDWCLIDTDTNKYLWNRNFVEMKPIVISGHIVTGTMPCLAEIEVISKDGNKTTTFELTIDEKLKDEIMIKKDGKWDHFYSKSTKKDQSLKAQNNELEKEPKSIVEKAELYGFEFPRIVAKQKEEITKLELIKICLKMIEQKNKTIIPNIQTNIFIDTDSEAANKAFQLGLVSTNIKRKLYPNNTVKREELAYMLYKTIQLTEKTLNKNNFHPIAYKDINSINSKYKQAMTILSIQNNYIKSESKIYIMPTQKVNIQEAISSAINILENLK